MHSYERPLCNSNNFRQSNIQRYVYQISLDMTNIDTLTHPALEHILYNCVCVFIALYHIKLLEGLINRRHHETLNRDVGHGCRQRAIPYPEPVYTGWSSVHWNALECHWFTLCILGYHWATQRILARHTGTPLEKLSWNRPTLGCHWRNSNFCSLHWNTTGRTVTAHTRPNTYS